MVIAALFPSGLTAGGKYSNIGELAAMLEAVPTFQATVNYAVSLPQAEDDIVYTVDLLSERAENDPLSPVDYLIKWSLPTRETVSEGFLSYSKGSHYRYRDHRLQEYHFEWDSIPFQTRGGGVQANGQFVDLLPQSLGAQLRAMSADSTFTVRFFADTLVSGEKSTVVKATQNVRGFDGRYFTLIADPATGLPRRLVNEFNPGQVSEQEVQATFSYPAGSPAALPEGEEALIAMFPEVFEKYRESNYRVENLRGLPMPQISLPTTTGERYTHHKGDRFQFPTVIALLDPTVGSVGETVKALRKASASLPMQNTLVMAFVTSNADMIEEVVPQVNDNERLLMSARGLARDCGVNEFPVVIVAGRDGVIEETVLGFNSNLAESVIQAVARAN